MTELSDLRVVVTGGAGFIGSHVCERLLDSGAQVVALDDLSTGSAENLRAAEARGARLVRGDCRDRKLLRQLLGGADAVIHLAALVSVQRSIAEPEEGFERNAHAGFAVLSAAAACGLPVVYASSAAVYGASDVSPQDEAGPVDPVSPYGADKLYLEYLSRGLRARDLRSIGLRLFNVYGPRQSADSPYSGVVSRFAARLAAGERCTIFGDGLQSRDFVHVTDVATCVARGVAHLLGMKSAPACAAVFNCGTGVSVSVAELFRVMAGIAGSDLGPLRGPPASGEVRHSCAAIARIHEELGWSPAVTLEDGLRALLAASP